jgi:folate-binding protein YgfZ
MIPAVSLDAYTAARQRAGLVDRADRARIVVSGADRAAFLQGLLTNDIVALKAGQGCYAAYLTAQGRMIADLYVYELGDVLLLTLHRDVKDAVMTKLDQVIFSEDVQLGDVTETFAQIAMVGPAAASMAAGVLDLPAETLHGMPEHGNFRTTWRASPKLPGVHSSEGGAGSSPAIVTRAGDTGEPGFDLFVERVHAEALKTSLMAAGAIEVDPATAEAIRIESGVPLFHHDMDEDTIPLEAGIESRAISFSKGCYVGQEVVIRVLHRGHGRVARKLVGLRLEGDRVPQEGSVIRAGDREVGRVTSSTQSPALRQPIALGYVHRDFIEPGAKVTVDGAAAEVVALPFVRPAV